MKLYRNIERQIANYNDTPQAVLDNLSPNEMHTLIHETYEAHSRVRFHKIISNEVLDKVWLFRIAEDFLHLLNGEGSIKLTPLGALPKKWVVALYEKKYVLEELLELGIYKLSREQDSVSIQSARLTLEVAGITKRLHGKLILTKKGTQFLLPENRQAFFECFMANFADKFMWAYNDGYPEVPFGQVGWTFIIYLLAKYGGETHNASFYADKYLNGLPTFHEYFKNEDSKYSCFEVRVIDRFLMYFGLVDSIVEKNVDRDSMEIWVTPIFAKVFEVDVRK